jgi:DNA-binding NtrC family response regulator
VIVLTAHGEWENAVNAMRLGAFNFVNKDSLHEEVESILIRAVEQGVIKKRLVEGGTGSLFVDIVGKSAGILRVQEVIRRQGLPEALCAIVLIDGHWVARPDRATRTLAEGQVLAIWPPIAGG